MAASNYLNVESLSHHLVVESLSHYLNVESLSHQLWTLDSGKSLSLLIDTYYTSTHLNTKIWSNSARMTKQIEKET